MTNRIAFCGASGPGKTFLTKRLAAALGLELQPSFPRAVAADMGFASPYDVDAAGRRDDFQKLVLARMIAWQQDHWQVGFVADRSVFDVLTYSHIHCGERTYLECADAVRLHPELRYTRLVVCPIASFFKLGGDHVAYQLGYERILRKMVEAYEHPLDVGLDRVGDLGRAAWIDNLAQELRR